MDPVQQPRPEIWPGPHPLAPVPLPAPAHAQYPAENYPQDLHFFANVGYIFAGYFIPPPYNNPAGPPRPPPGVAANPPAANPQPQVPAAVAVQFPPRPHPIPRRGGHPEGPLWNPIAYNHDTGNYYHVNPAELPIRRHFVFPHRQVVDDSPVKTECPVCFDRYSKTSHPKIGSCGHSICYTCEMKIQNRRCPFCNAEGAFRYSHRNFLAEHLIAEQYDTIKEHEEELKKKEAEIAEQREKLEQLEKEMKKLTGEKGEPEAGPSRAVKRNLDDEEPIERKLIKMEPVEDKEKTEVKAEEDELEEEEGEEEDEEPVNYAVEMDESNNQVIVIEDSD